MSCFPNPFLDLSYFTGAHVDHSHLLGCSVFLEGGRLLTCMVSANLNCFVIMISLQGKAFHNSRSHHSQGWTISLLAWCPLHIQGCCHKGSSEHTAPEEHLPLHLLYNWRARSSLTTSLCHSLHNPRRPGASPTTASCASCICTGSCYLNKLYVCAYSACIDRYVCM